VLAALRELDADLRRRYGPRVRDVRLFGSFARGEANEDSDVDVLVVLDHVDWPTRRDVIDRATDVGLPRSLLMSPLVLDEATYERWRTQQRALLLDIERDGIRP
jgi:predicted nucleotidyltransferase